jgi:hypothetical protein
MALYGPAASWAGADISVFPDSAVASSLEAQRRCRAETAASPRPPISAGHLPRRPEPSMKINIDTLPETELIDLNNRIVERLRFLRQMRAHAEMLEFRIGNRVEFHADARQPIVGLLTRYNKRTVTVITDKGERWNVAPGLLRRPGEPSRSETADSKGLRLLERSQ